MADRPILFSAPMVRALLDGRKTQTRRVLKPQPDPRRISDVALVDGVWCWRNGHDGSLEGRVPLPYAPGDRLWVREAWHPVMEDHPVAIYGADHEIVYHDTGRREPNVIYELPKRWRPSIHMPRWASRLTLIVANVRVQRVQEISGADAAQEGIVLDFPGGHHGAFNRARHAFRDLWNSINAKRGFGWDANPWIIALTFTVHRQNIDQMQQETAA